MPFRAPLRGHNPLKKKNYYYHAMASRRSITPALCALRQAVRPSGAARLRTFQSSSKSVAARTIVRQGVVTVPGQGPPPAAAAMPAGIRRRWYSQQQPGDNNKIWSFEEVRVTRYRWGRAEKGGDEAGGRVDGWMYI